jgi:hypothetical protein
VRFRLYVDDVGIGAGTAGVILATLDGIAAVSQVRIMKADNFGLAAEREDGGRFVVRAHDRHTAISGTRGGDSLNLNLYEIVGNNRCRSQERRTRCRCNK